MSNFAEKPCKKMTLRLFEEDLEYLRLAYPTGGYNRIVRALVARHVRALRNRTIEHFAEGKLSEDEISSV